MNCPHCGAHIAHNCPGAVPPEPPIGTWMRDRHGGLTVRQKDGWAPPGFLPCGKWSAMWAARGPYEECGEWGRELVAVVDAEP